MCATTQSAGDTSAADSLAARAQEVLRTAAGRYIQPKQSLKAVFQIQQPRPAQAASTSPPDASDAGVRVVAWPEPQQMESLGMVTVQWAAGAMKPATWSSPAIQAPTFQRLSVQVLLPKLPPALPIMAPQVVDCYIVNRGGAPVHVTLRDLVHDAMTGAGLQSDGDGGKTHVLCAAGVNDNVLLALNHAKAVASRAGVVCTAVSHHNVGSIPAQHAAVVQVTLMGLVPGSHTLQGLVALDERTGRPLHAANHRSLRAVPQGTVPGRLPRRSGWGTAHSRDESAGSQAAGDSTTALPPLGTVDVTL